MAGKNDDTSFCGTNPLKLGIHDGYGVNPLLQGVDGGGPHRGQQVRQRRAGRARRRRRPPEVDLRCRLHGHAGHQRAAIIPDFGQGLLASLQAATQAGVSVVPWGVDLSGVDGTDFVQYVD
ncbi:MAG: hypothetical protein U0869_06185 [Chloroflexota bacterium]